MQMKNQVSILLITLTIFVNYGQHKNETITQIKPIENVIQFKQIKTDTLFNSNQIISLLVLQNNAFNNYNIEFGYHNLELKTTSSLAKEKNAVAAINGGFFNMDSGGSVTYFEVNDTVVNKTRDPNKKWGISKSLMNGAIIIENNFQITIQAAKPEQFYETSKQESGVLITGPLLLLNSEKLKMPNSKFVTNRHPRTCLCETEKSVMFITVDGRQKEAQGMSLFEVQEFLKSIGCKNAINLDGGGSTTMWTQNKGIVNFPSDKTGERPVANSLLILNKSN